MYWVQAQTKEKNEWKTQTKTADILDVISDTSDYYFRPPIIMVIYPNVTLSIGEPTQAEYFLPSLDYL